MQGEKAQEQLKWNEFISWWDAGSQNMMPLKKRHFSGKCVLTELPVIRNPSHYDLLLLPPSWQDCAWNLVLSTHPLSICWINNQNRNFSDFYLECQPLSVTGTLDLHNSSCKDLRTLTSRSCHPPDHSLLDPGSVSHSGQSKESNKGFDSIRFRSNTIQKASVQGNMQRKESPPIILWSNPSPNLIWSAFQTKVSHTSYGPLHSKHYPYACLHCLENGFPDFSSCTAPFYR